MSAALDCYFNETEYNSTKPQPGPGTNKDEITEQDSLQWELWVGIGATFLSSVAVSIGSIIQKLAHNINQRKEPEDRSMQCGGLLCNPLWLAGLALMITLQIPLSFAALTLAPQSLVIPLGAGSTIVFNQIFAPLILKEKLTQVEMYATIVILVGVILSTVAAGGGGTDNMTACDLINRYTETDFLVPMIVLIAFIVIAVILIHCFKPGKHPITIQNLLPALFGFVAGGLGAIMNILLKASGKFTQAVIVGTDYGTWKTIHPYYHIGLVILLACFMISYINLGLEKYNAVVFLPLYNCIYILLSTAYGALFFREFDQYSGTQLFLIILGILITLVGISMMSVSGARFSRYTTNARTSLRNFSMKYRPGRRRKPSRGSSAQGPPDNGMGSSVAMEGATPIVGSFPFPEEKQMLANGSSLEEEDGSNGNGEGPYIIEEDGTVPQEDEGVIKESLLISTDIGNEGAVSETRGSKINLASIGKRYSGSTMRSDEYQEHTQGSPPSDFAIGLASAARKLSPKGSRGTSEEKKIEMALGLM